MIWFKNSLLKVSFAVPGVSRIFSLITAYMNIRWIIGLAVTVKVTEQLLLFVLVKTVLKLYLTSIKNVLGEYKNFYLLISMFVRIYIFIRISIVVLL